MAAEPEPRRRAFFALWPDDATRARVVRTTERAVGAAGGRPTPQDQLHLTIAFLGGLTAAELDRARAAPPITVGAFELALDTLGFWQQSQILWLGPSTVPLALQDLERRLWEVLTGRGFAREPLPYRPHLTLARGARAVAAPVAAIRWPIDALALVESLPLGPGARYAILDRWPL